jgi:signal transduction histidine kinase
MSFLENASYACKDDDEIFISTKLVGDEIVMKIEDNGAGMDEETLAKLFDPFFTTKPVGKGMGLGLSISYGIIQQHDGRIDVTSEVEKGAKFTVYLPKMH